MLIPVENQVRELDPKLLLACVAARRGFSSVIGSRREMEFNIDAYPKSIYLSKSMTVRSLLFFRVAKRFGHEIVAWDEEALVHLPAETYFSRRLDPKAIKFVSHFFAWGKGNAELWRQYPQLPENKAIHITGNPRIDLLRPELRIFYEQEAAEFRKQYGDFILVNTNFNHVNAFGPDMNLFKPAKRSGQKPKFGRAARGMSREYAEGLRDHKLAVLEEFKKIIPKLEGAFPDHTIVVRPHPTENHEVYHKIAKRSKRIKVTNEGNVVPWLMAAKALIHNGCTTGVEAYAMGIPAITYRAAIDDRYDDGFYRLPNRLSHQCFDFEQLRHTLQRILDADLGPADGDERQTLLARYLTGRDGKLACERIVDVIEQIARNWSDAPAAALRNRLEQWIATKGLHAVRAIKSKLPGSHNRPEFQRHRYPSLPLEVLRQRIAKFQQLLGYQQELSVEQISNVIFRINA